MSTKALGEMMASKKLWIYGAGGHAKVVADLAHAVGWRVVGFIDDDPGKVDASANTPVLSWDQFRSLPRDDRARVAFGIGNNRDRQGCFRRIQADHIELVTLIHPSAVISPKAQVGAGTVAMACTAVNADANIGVGAVLNTGCVVEHDAKVGDFVHVSSNATLGGAVQLGERALVGLGAVILPGVNVASDVRIGAGAVVIKNVAPGLTVVGVPASPVDESAG